MPELTKFNSAVPCGRKNAAKNLNGSRDENLFSKKIRELRLELEIRKREEERIEKDISIILEESSLDGGEQNRSFGLSVTRLNNHMLVVENQAKQLTNTLKNISSLADTISGRVSALDVAKTRVCGCLQLASDMKDLGQAAEGIDDAIREEDFGTAVTFIHSFLTLDQSVFQYREYKEKDSTDSIKRNYEVLSLAKERLSKILKSKLEDAVKKGDVAEMTRFVKLFPPINEADEGLKRFGVWICQKIDKLAEENIAIMLSGGTDDKRRNVLYADTLFMFFDGISGIIETNMEILESSYGGVKLLDFMFILQARIDEFFRRLLAEFDKNRKVSSIIRQIGGNLYNKNTNLDSVVDIPDANDIDQIVAEICMMNSSVELYWRFVGRRIGNEPEITTDSSDFANLDEQEKMKEKIRERKETKTKKLDQLLNRSLVGTKMQELIGDYIQMEHYYMQKSVQKAIKMDAKDDPEEMVSSINDDVVFIVRKCIRRSASSGSVDSVCATINNAISMLDTTIHQYFNQYISEGYLNIGFASEALATAQTAFSTAYQGKQAGSTHLTPEKKKELFILAVNNASKLGELLKELQKGLVAEWSGLKRAEVEKSKLEHSTTQIEEVAKRLELLGKHGVSELFKADFKKKLREFFEPYSQKSHQLTMEDLEHFAANDPFMDYFMSAVQNQLDEFKDILSLENYQVFLLNTCTEIARIFEKNLTVCQYNRYGTLQLDREYRNLVGFLTKHAGWVVREKCSRLDQIVSLLNVETVEEAVELWHSSKSFPGRSLTLLEVKRVLALRIDLPSVAIQSIDG